MNCSPPSPAERLASALLEGLRAELFLTPKPGLVDLLDNGSHPDLSLPKMLASIDLIGHYFRELFASLAAGADLTELVCVGRRAEERMLALLGTNTHRGAIFLCGLLLVARFRTPAGEELGQSAVAAVAGEVLAFSSPAASHGEAARRNWGVGGVLEEARAGLPSLFEVALPAWRQARAAGESARRAAFLVLARLMQSVEDTTALHRCGRAGLECLRRDGLRLEATLACRLDPVPLLAVLNAEYRAMNLTMGGVADLLGLAFGCLAYEGVALGDAELRLEKGAGLPAAAG